MEKKWYIYIPGIHQTTIQLFNSESTAHATVNEIRRFTNLEAYVCEFGYPFA